MERKNTSICSRIKQALASYPAFRAIHRIKQYNKPEPSNKPITITNNTSHSNNNSASNSSLPPRHTAKNTAIFQSNPPQPQNFKVGTTEKGEGSLIPINFDYSTTPSSSSSISRVQGQAAKVASTIKGTAQQGPNLKGQHHHHHHQGLGMQNSDQQQGKKSLDINDTFEEYIQRARHKIRSSASNVGRSNQGNYSASDHEANASTNYKMESHHNKDHFGDFILHAKKKIRTTSNVGGKAGSFKRG